MFPVDTLYYDCRGCRLRHFLFEPSSSVEIREYIKASNWEKYELSCIGCGRSMRRRKLYPVRYPGSSIVGPKVIRFADRELGRIVKVKGPPVNIKFRAGSGEGSTSGGVVCALCSVRLEGLAVERLEWRALRLGRGVIVVCGRCEGLSGPIRWDGVGMLGRLPVTYRD